MNYVESMNERRAEIRENVEEYGKARDAILADGHLTQEGKTAKLDKVYQTALERHQRLVRDLEEERSMAQMGLRRAAFGVDSGSMADYRAALELADQKATEGPGSLGRFLERSITVGDKNGAKAAATIAAQRGDHHVMVRYKAVYPTSAEAIMDLEDFEAQHGDRRSAQVRFHDKVELRAPQLPDGYYLSGSGVRAEPLR